MQEPTRQENVEEAAPTSTSTASAAEDRKQETAQPAAREAAPTPEPPATAPLAADSKQETAQPAAREAVPAPEPPATAPSADSKQETAQPAAREAVPAPEPTATASAAADSKQGTAEPAVHEAAPGPTAQGLSGGPDSQAPHGATEPAPVKPAEPQKAKPTEPKPSGAPASPPDAHQKRAAQPQHAEGIPEAASQGEKSVSTVKSMFEQPSPTKPQAPSAKPEGGFKPRSASSAAAAAEAPQKPAKANGTTPPAAVTHAPSSAHDHKNTVNVAQLLKSGTFSRIPGKDLIPYAELRTLRLEDGIDATQKENYLSPDEFEQVFQMPREAYEKLPGWKKAQAKKNVQLF